MLPRRTISVATLVLLSGFLVPGAVLSQTSDSPATRIAKSHLPAIVTIIAVDHHDQPLALGSGFFVSDSGVIATNAHVVEGASRVIVRWRGQNGRADRILKFDPRYDLVTIATSFSATPRVILGDPAVVTVGQDVIVLGNPQGLEGTVSTGILSGVRVIDGVRFLQITAPISPGSSGGPVFNAQGHVIGITTATLAKGQNLNFALPANLLRELPPSTASFATTKHIPPDRRQAEGVKDLVFFSNFREEFGYPPDKLVSLTASLQNRTSNTIGDVKVLIIIKSPDGDVIDFRVDEFKHVVPPGLAKQVYIPIGTQGFRRWSISAKPGVPRRENGWRLGSYEIRLLDFKILSRGGGATEQLFRRP